MCWNSRIDGSGYDDVRLETDNPKVLNPGFAMQDTRGVAMHTDATLETMARFAQS